MTVIEKEFVIINFHIFIDRLEFAKDIFEEGTMDSTKV